MDNTETPHVCGYDKAQFTSDDEIIIRRLMMVSNPSENSFDHAALYFDLDKSTIIKTIVEETAGWTICSVRQVHPEKPLPVLPKYTPGTVILFMAPTDEVHKTHIAFALSDNRCISKMGTYPDLHITPISECIDLYNTRTLCFCRYNPQ